MEKRKVSIFVAGQRFNILTDENEKYVIDIAAKIDAHITSLTISQNITRERAAVLTALDFADDNEQDKRAIAEIKEQVKDYLTRISTLSDENTTLNAENNQLKREIAAMKEAQDTKANSLKEAADEKKEKEALRAQIRALKEQMELMNQEKAPDLSDADAPAENPVEEPVAEEEEIPSAEETVTAEDDLFFGAQEEPAVKPQKEKKNRHSHSHVNPYKQQFMNKKNEQKGYTQQRQYSLFDKDE